MPRPRARRIRRSAVAEMQNIAETVEDVARASSVRQHQMGNRRVVPKKYGDKVQNGGDPDGPIEHQVGITVTFHDPEKSRLTRSSRAN